MNQNENDDKSKEISIYIAENLRPVKKNLLDSMERSIKINETIAESTRKIIKSIENRLEEMKNNPNKKFYKTKEEYERQLQQQKDFLEKIEYEQEKAKERLEKLRNEEKGIDGIIEIMKNRC